jgi:serine/threonine protein kinase
MVARVSQPATRSAPRLAPPRRLGRYELVCPVAEGRTASVWVARQQTEYGVDKIVALKVTLPKFADDDRFRQMLLASCIDHPNVAQIFDVGEERGVLFMAMEYVDGDSLSRLSHACQERGGALPNGVMLRVLADACAGLHQAHELKDAMGRPLGIVHRDVSPQNILVSRDGVAKLVDFGIVNGSGAGGDAEKGLERRTSYAAPEQEIGPSIDRRADIWAVGAILSQLAGSAPEMHPAIARVVRRALADRPHQRYATAAQMREALERAMREAGIATATEDVAACFAKYLGGRADQRRRSIERAIAGGAVSLPTDSPMRSAVISIPRTRIQKPVRVGAVAHPQLRPPRRWPMLVALAIAVVGAGIGLGNLLRQRRAQGEAWLTSAHAETGKVVPAITATTPNVSPPTLPHHPDDPLVVIPLVAASSLPRVAVPISEARPDPGVRSRSPTVTSATTTPTAPKKPEAIDDGF